MDSAALRATAGFLRLVAYSYLIGNGDLHAKNVSLLADGPSGGLRLSPAYDLLSTLPYRLGENGLSERKSGDLRRTMAKRLDELGGSVGLP